MIFRRLRERISRQDWLGVGIDFLILIVGVFLGLLAQDRSFRALLTILRGAAANSYELCTRQRRFASEAIELLTVSLDD